MSGGGGGGGLNKQSAWWWRVLTGERVSLKPRRRWWGRNYNLNDDRNLFLLDAWWSRQTLGFTTLWVWLWKRQEDPLNTPPPLLPPSSVKPQIPHFHVEMKAATSANVSSPSGRRIPLWLEETFILKFQGILGDDETGRGVENKRIKEDGLSLGTIIGWPHCKNPFKTLINEKLALLTFFFCPYSVKVLCQKCRLRSEFQLFNTSLTFNL